MNTKRSFYSKVLFYSLVTILIILFGSRAFAYEWSKTFGGTNYERGMSVELTTDGGYIIVGYAGIDPLWDSPGDIYLIKTDIGGNELWSKTFGGSGSEDGISVRQTTDGGYIIIGNTTSGGGVLT